MVQRFAVAVAISCGLVAPGFSEVMTKSIERRAVKLGDALQFAPPPLPAGSYPLWDPTFEPVFNPSLADRVTATQSASGPQIGDDLGSYWFNRLNINDRVSASDDNLNVYGAMLKHDFGGSGTKGYRIGFASIATLTAPPDPASYSPFYVGGWFWARAQANAGGRPGAFNGSVVASNPQVSLFSGATYYNNAVGEEIDVGVIAGASVKNKIGLNITTIGRDAVAGTVIDAAVQIGSVASSPKWTDGFLLSARNGGSPLNSNGTVIRSDTPLSIKDGINFSNFNFSGHPFQSPFFAVDGMGLVTGRGGFQFLRANDGTPATRIYAAGDVNPVGAMTANIGDAYFRSGADSAYVSLYLKNQNATDGEWWPVHIRRTGPTRTRQTDLGSGHEGAMHWDTTTSKQMFAGGSPGVWVDAMGRVEPISGISAAGTTQVDATALSYAHSSVSTVAAGSGVKLPALQRGQEMIVFNLAGSELKVYPATGSNLNLLDPNAATTLGSGAAMTFVGLTATAVGAK